MPLADKTFLSHHVYLFIIDLSLFFSFGRQIPDYEAEEPGYTLGILRGYQYAFAKQDVSAPSLSHEFLKGLHKQVMHHHPEFCGKYLTHPAHFQLFTDQNSVSGKVCTASASFEGVLEFIQSSLAIPEATHSLVLNCVGIDEQTALRESICLEGKDRRLLMMHEVKAQDYLAKRDNPIIQSALQLTGKLQSRKHKGFLCGINSLLQSPDEVESKLSAIFASYYKMILQAQADDEKLRVIVSHVQRISQRHPFDDGNTRLCTILLNRLLKENHLPFTLLFNPNRFDGFSIDELVQFVKEGQQYCAELLQANTPAFETDVYLNRARLAGLQTQDLPPITLPADPAMKQAVDNFVHLLQLEQQSLVAKARIKPSSQLPKCMMFKQYDDASSLITNEFLVQAHIEEPSSCKFALSLRP